MITKKKLISNISKVEETNKINKTNETNETNETNINENQNSDFTIIKKTFKINNLTIKKDINLITKQDEPIKDELNKDEPIKDEPNKNEPNKDELNKDEPNKDEPNKDEPNKNEPNKDEPNKDEPNKNEPNKDELNKDEPNKDEPNKDEPNKNEPNKDEPNKDEPIKNEPNKNEPIKNEPKSVILKSNLLNMINKKIINDKTPTTEIQDYNLSDDELNEETKAELNEYKNYDDCNILNYIKKIDVKNCKQDKLEDILDTLETYLHELKMALRYCKQNKLDNKLDMFKLTEKKLNNVIGEIKKTINSLKITKSETMKNKIIEEFKKKYKKLSDKDFLKTIDLTQPKADRKPEPGVVLWLNSKETIYKDPKYKKYTATQERDFKNNLKKKLIQMTDDIKDKLDSKRNSIAIHTYNPEFFKNRKYDPFNTNNGLEFF